MDLQNNEYNALVVWMSMNVAIANANMDPMHDEYINPRDFADSISFSNIINESTQVSKTFLASDGYSALQKYLVIADYIVYML